MLCWGDKKGSNSIEYIHASSVQSIGIFEYVFVYLCFVSSREGAFPLGGQLHGMMGMLFRTRGDSKTKLVSRIPKGGGRWLM